MAKYLPFFLLVLLIPDVYLQDVYRLPTNVVPVSYIVDFNINPDVFTGEDTTYSGVTNITVLVNSSTNEIKLHLNTQYITLLTNFTIDGTPGAHTINETTETITITTASALDPGNHSLYVTYNGTVSTTDMYGVYRSSYVDATGAIKYLITTQFQPTYARRAFPCFDEPAFKATFQLRFITDNSQTVLTNTKNQTAVGDLQQIFHFTPIMSTYLVAFTISEFTCDDPVLIDGVENRICSKNESSAERAWANEIAPKILESMNLYTNVNYNTTIDKLDQVAIPDFAAGAMENWGMATYREQYLLYNENESSNMDKQFVATILAHEIAHQWFGNLVTAEWWSELFLNEGFADYFEYFATHKVLPDWQMDRQYVIDTVQRALRADEGSALPLQHNVSSPTEILLMFNVISYSKGGSIFRMLEHVINSTNWEAGLTNYLTARVNAVPEDLWNILQTQISADNTSLPQGVTLNQVMENWVKQSGFPLLTVTNNNGTVTINQTQFSANENLTQVWYVPISYTTSVDANKFQSTTPQVWLPATNESITFNLSPGAQWIILNNLQTGFYRVNYDANSWDAIELALKATNFSDIDELNRAGIVDDLFSLAKINKIAYSRIFKLLEFLKEDRSYFSWYPAFTGFNFLIDRFGLRSELGTKIAAHLLELMTPLYESTPFSSINETDQIYTLKQRLALGWACLLGHTDCITISTQLFAAYKANVNNRTNKNLRSTVYCTALKESTDNTDWDFLWNVYNTSTLASEKSLLLSTLSCSKDTVILQRFLNLSLTDESIRSQDRYTIFQNVVNNPDGINIARQFFMDRHAEIVEKYQTLTVISNILELLASKVTNQQEFADLETFITSGSLSADQVEEGKRALVTAQANVQWLQEYENDIRSYYEQQTNATEPTIPGGSTNATTPTIPGGSTNATTPTIPGGSTNDTEPTNPDALTTPSTPGSSAVASYKFGLIVSLLYILYSFN